jgi:hypothetical protein
MTVNTIEQLSVTAFRYRLPSLLIFGMFSFLGSLLLQEHSVIDILSRLVLLITNQRVNWVIGPNH